MVTDRLRPNAPVVNTASWTMSPSVTTTRDGVSVTHSLTHPLWRLAHSSTHSLTHSLSLQWMTVISVTLTPSRVVVTEGDIVQLAVFTTGALGRSLSVTIVTRTNTTTCQYSHSLQSITHSLHFSYSVTDYTSINSTVTFHPGLTNITVTH